MISFSSSRGVGRLLLLVCVYEFPKLFPIASGSLYHNIPHHANYFVWLYQDWLHCILCKEKHLCLLHTMTNNPCVTSSGCMKVCHCVLYNYMSQLPPRYWYLASPLSFLAYTSLVHPSWPEHRYAWSAAKVIDLSDIVNSVIWGIRGGDPIR